MGITEVVGKDISLYRNRMPVTTVGIKHEFPGSKCKELKA